jgi:hypothetical protein
MNEKMSGFSGFMTVGRLFGVAAVVGLVAGCDIGTGAAGEAAVDVYVDGSGGPEGAGPSYSWGGTSNGSAEGSVEVRARVWVEAAGGGWKEVTRGTAVQRVEIDGRDGGKVLVRGRLPAGSYSRVRIEFERVEADVRGEIRIGLGTLAGEVQVGSESEGRIVVEREVLLVASGSRQSSVHVALNAGEWLQRANTGSRTVAAADFQSAVRLFVR